METHKQGVHRVMLTIPKNIHYRAKIRAAVEERTLGELIADATERYLEDSEEVAPRAKEGRRKEGR
jgi:hypothetical protein